MGVVVAKLGSAIVADEEGAVRREVLACVCEQVAEQRARGRQVVIVTSGAIAIGMRAMGLPGRPSAGGEPPAAAGGGGGRAAGGVSGRAGTALPRVRAALDGSRDTPGAGAAHVLRHVGAHALPE